MINTDYIEKCVDTLELAYSEIIKVEKNTLHYELFRSAIIKEFEIIIEQSGKLLKKELYHFLPTKNAVDQLYFKDVFRHAAKYDILSLEESERWLEYHDNRNALSHEYGKELAEATLTIILKFITDSRALIDNLKSKNKK
jgi:nucleotidyltransferase substrate binding protein (TIGR01987 family)